MDKCEAARHWLVKTALSYLGKPYRWGGDDPSGFDCSGLVLECLKSAGLVRDGDLTADALWRLFADYRVNRPVAGALVFRLNFAGKAEHVAVCLDKWYQIGASGGGSPVTTEASAWQKNAFVKIRPVGSSDNLRFCNPVLRLRDRIA